MNISLSLSSIREFEITSGRLVSTGYVTISWQDELLVWNSSDFGGVSKLNIPEKSYWKPGLVFVKSPGEESLTDDSSFKPSWAMDNGLVNMFVAGDFETICDTDTGYFPFDSHKCDYEIFSTKYDVSEMMLVPSKDKIQLDNLVEHGEWYIRDTGCKKSVITDKESSISISALSNVLTIERRPSFVIMHTAGPLVLLQCLNVVACLVPPDSGERVSFAVTVFLSFIFLSGTVLAELPRNSLRITVLSLELLTVNIISTLSVLWSVYIVRLSRRDERNWKIPSFITRIKKMMHKSQYELRATQEVDLSFGSVNNVIETKFPPQELNSDDNDDFTDSFMKVEDAVKLLDNVYFCLNLSLYLVMNTTLTFLFVSL